MSSAPIQARGFISYCSPVQDRMTDTNTGVYEFDNGIRSPHVYKTVWTPLIDEMLQVHNVGRYQRT